jgi:hypothetical protein
MQLAMLGKLIKNQPVMGVINIFVNIEIKTIRNAEEIPFQVKVFVLNIIYKCILKLLGERMEKCLAEDEAAKEN